MKVNEEILVIYWDINEMLFCEEQKVMESLKEHAAAVREPLNISPMNIDGRMAGHRVEGTASLWQKIYTSPQLHRSAPSINSDPLPSISSFHRPMILEIDWMDEQTNELRCFWSSGNRVFLERRRRKAEEEEMERRRVVLSLQGSPAHDQRGRTASTISTQFKC